MTTPILKVQNITKSFPGVKALKGVSLELYPGELLALIGENGAGKSTLMKILAGIQPPDSGQMEVNGRPVQLQNVQQATDVGIALIHQELNLCSNLDLAANIYLGREPQRCGWLNQGDLYAEAERYLLEIGITEPPTSLAGSLSVGKQQMVEIAKAVSTDANILIMDEPTSSLSRQESQNLFDIIRRLKQKGVSIIYISHRLGEVEELADRVEVFRDGENAGELKKGEIHHDSMVRLMVGREINELFQQREFESQRPILQVKDLVTPAHPEHSISFEVNRGEIVGIAGLVGAGRTEMLMTLFGVTPALGGSIQIDEETIDIDSPVTAIRAGMALVPEDRKKDGLVLEMAVRENLSLPSLDQLSFLSSFTRLGPEQNLNDRMVDQLSIKTPSGDQQAKFLSGGNQQKIVIAKWLALNPRILLLDEPTRGVDIGAKREIYELIHLLAESGETVIFVSSEMEEVIGLSDRIIVMHEGRITGELEKSDFSENAIMTLATGKELVATG